MTQPPQFVHADSQLVTRELIDAYELMAGKTLYPAQVERLLIDLIAYRETLVRSAINDAARQNLVQFARAPMLDYLGQLVGVTRLPAKSARTTVRLAFAAPLRSGVAIPAGFRVETAGNIHFQTTAEVLASVDAAHVDLDVYAVEAGLEANGYLPGQVMALVDDVSVDVAAVANLSVTSGGADEETDDRLRARIMLAPESFSVAGSRLAYRHHAMSAHQSITDVAVLSPSPGVVHLFPLTSSGLPTPAILDAVASICSDDKVRPLTDQVAALPPVQTNYSVVARLTVYRDRDVTATLAAARTSVAAFTATQAASLGRDIVPSQIIAALSVAGVYQVALTSPQSALNIPSNGWAHCEGIDIQLNGSTNG